MDPYDLPEAFSHLQAQDMGKLGFMQDLLRGIKKITDSNKAPAANPTADSVVAVPPSGVESLVKRGYLFLEDSNWGKADEYFDRVLDIEPEYAPAYVGKLCAELKKNREVQLGQNEKPLTDYNHYQKAIRFADEPLRKRLETYNQAILAYQQYLGLQVTLGLYQPVGAATLQLPAYLPLRVQMRKAATLE